jgi:MinD-like ATPase involved in chromosome partitioning or flagellar assembly
VALNLAFELSALGKRTILMDLDTWSPSLGTLLKLKETPAGLCGAARLIRQGRFNPDQLERLSVQVKHRRVRLSVLPGIGAPSRWSEISPDSVSQLVSISKHDFDVVLLDISSQLDENLFDTAHPVGRNAVPRAALTIADLCVVVLRGSELSLSRYLGNFSELQELQKNRLIVLNQSNASKLISASLKSLTRESIASFIPEDAAAFELAESVGLPLALARRKSPARTAIGAFAHKLLAWPPSVS